MKIEDMNLEQVTARLAELDEEVRAANKVEDIESATEEKTNLLERKAELEDLEARKQNALNITAGNVNTKTIETRKDVKDMNNNIITVESPEYRNAFLKKLMGKNLDETEQRSIAAVNVAGAIPTETYNQIISKIKQTAPLLDEVTLLNVAGNVNFAVEGTNNAAALHTENGESTPKADTLVTVSLAGYEIVKIVRISATVQNMTIGSFESWLVEQLAEAVARVIENYMINGTGDNQPKGINAITYVANTNGVQFATANKPTYAELCKIVSLLPGGYARNAKWLINHKTFWGNVQAIRDDGKAPIVANDNGTYRIMGFPVLFSDYVADGSMYLGDFKKVVANLSQDIKVDKSTESGFIYNAVDYRGTATFDCDIAVDEAFVKGANSI